MSYFGRFHKYVSDPKVFIWLNTHCTSAWTVSVRELETRQGLDLVTFLKQFCKMTQTTPHKQHVKKTGHIIWSMPPVVTARLIWHTQMNGVSAFVARGEFIVSTMTTVVPFRQLMMRFSLFHSWYENDYTQRAHWWSHGDFVYHVPLHKFTRKVVKLTVTTGMISCSCIVSLCVHQYPQWIR